MEMEMEMEMARWACCYAYDREGLEAE